MVERYRTRPKSNGQGRTPIARYYQGTKNPTASPFVKKPPAAKSRHFLSKSLNVVLVIAILGCLIYSLTLSPQPKVVTSSTAYRTAKTYSDAAAKQFDPLKNRTKPTLDEQAIAGNLIRQFPEVTQATVSVPVFGQKPIVRLDISPPSFVISSGSERYIVDRAGIAVGSELRLPAVKNLPLVDDQSGYKISVGSQVLSIGSVSFINQLVAQAKISKVTISNITLPPLAQELDLKTSDKPYYTKFFLGGDPSIQIGQFLAARHQFAANHQDPTQYLDVRVAGKIYFK